MNPKLKNSEPISEATFQRVYHMLERQYPGEVWITIELRTFAGVKIIDNESDALALIGEAREIGPRLRESEERLGIGK